MPDMRMHIRIEEVQEDPVNELQGQKRHDPAMLTVHLVCASEGRTQMLIGIPIVEKRLFSTSPEPGVRTWAFVLLNVFALSLTTVERPSKSKSKCGLSPDVA